MTDKEFRRLKRSQLIDIIYHLEKEIEEQKKTIEDLQKQLEDRTSGYRMRVLSQVRHWN